MIYRPLLPREFLVDQVTFAHLGIRRRGRGVLTWDPSTGFRLQAFLDRLSVQPEDDRPWEAVRILRREDRQLIRMRTSNDERVLADVPPLGQWDIDARDHLSLRFARAFFSQPGWNLAPDVWHGTALLDVADRFPWPDQLKTVETLDGERIRTGGAGAISYKDGTVELRARAVDDHHMEAHWALKRSAYSKQQAWRWSEALADALSILTGRSVGLVYHELAGQRRQAELRRSQPCQDLGLFQLVEQGYPLDKVRLLMLTTMLTRAGMEARIARSTFSQILAATRQASWPTVELLVSITLEGIVRALDGSTPMARSWEVGRGLTAVRHKYLSNDWRKACKRAADIFDDLRNAGAHPNWALDSQSPVYAQATKDSLAKMLFLCRFYGYLILALAGVKDIEPAFVNGEWLGSPEGPRRVTG